MGLLNEVQIFLLSPDLPGRDLLCTLKASIFYTLVEYLQSSKEEKARDLVTVCCLKEKGYCKEWQGGPMRDKYSELE